MFAQTRANLGISLAGAYIFQPFIFGRLVVGSEDFNLVAALQHVAHRHQLMIGFRADAMITQFAVQFEGKVERGGTLRNGFDFTLGRKDKNFRSEKIHLDGVQHIDGIGFRTFQNFLDGEDPTVQIVFVVDFVHLVFPMGGKTTFGNHIHTTAADLYFHPFARRPHHCGMKRLITIGFRIVDPVAQTIGMRLI